MLKEEMVEEKRNVIHLLGECVHCKDCAEVCKKCAEACSNFRKMFYK